MTVAELVQTVIDASGKEIQIQYVEGPVGDAAFQKKCLGKMGDMAKEGRTVF